MRKKPVSLELQLNGQEAPSETPDMPTAAAAAAAPAVASPPAQEKTTIYMPRAAMRCLKQMALDQDKRLNDLLQEGLDLMFERYGQPSLKDFSSR